MNDVDRPVDPGGSPGRSGSDAVVDLLTAMGVRYVPLTPGPGLRRLQDSLMDHGGGRDPQPLLCLHEEIAVSVAHGYAKATGDLAVAAVHDLVGLEHCSTAVHDASCDRSPVLVLGGRGPADPAQRRPVDGVHSATDQSQLVRAHVVWGAEPPTAAAAVEDVVRARQRALSAPGGPAYVSLDADLQEQRLDTPLVPPDLGRHAPVPASAPDPAALEQAAALLVAAERPVVVAGRVGLRPGATGPLVELVELLGAAYRDDRDVVAFPTAHRQNATGDGDLLRDADVVLAVDVADLRALMVRRTHGDRGECDDTAPDAVVIDLSHGDLGLHSRSNPFAVPVERTVRLPADPLVGLLQLTAAVRRQVDHDRAARQRDAVHRRVSGLKARQWAAVEERWDDELVSPARLVAETWRAVKDVDHLLCVRNTRTWPEGVWQFAGAGCYLGGSGGVGHGPGVLVGGALAARDRGQLGVGIVDDGDMPSAAGALWTATHHGIPALVVVNDTSSCSDDEPHQAQVARQRRRSTADSWTGMRMTDRPVDLTGLARSYGCWATGPVSDPAELEPVLDEGVARACAGAVAVVHVRAAPQ